MPFDSIVIIFGLFAVASFLLLDRSLINVICGFVLISNGANLFLLSLEGDPEGKQAPLMQGSDALSMPDPLPQAMILTAIVIGLGMLVFLAALIYEVHIVEKRGVRK